VTASDDNCAAKARLTLDGLFRRTAMRRPYATALVDPGNRAADAAGRPLRLRYAEADRVITALAVRLKEMGLGAGAVIGVQMPNVAEQVLTLLAIRRAGCVAALLPWLWRRADCVTALSRVAAKALITGCNSEDFDPAQMAMRVAAEVFSIRYVCGFGGTMPDGTVALDELLSPASPAVFNEGEPWGDDPAAITFEVGEDGPVAVARSDEELLAGGLPVFLESGIARQSAILSSIPPASFAGLAVTLVPWLLCGGALVLHDVFDADVLRTQLAEEHCGAVMLPAAFATALPRSNAIAVALWRSPELLASAPKWDIAGEALIDVSVFGEIGLAAARRADGHVAGDLPLGLLRAPRGSAAGVVSAELALGSSGTLLWRGPMVPRSAYPWGVEETDQPHYRADANGFVDTGYRCATDAASRSVIVTDAPAGFVSIGGYRFAQNALAETIRRIDPEATISVMADPLSGQRLRGTTTDHARLCAALDRLGINPLIAASFVEVPAVRRAAG
jgi:hypothetical protein